MKFKSMPNQQLLDYIRQQLQEGANRDEIKSSLISAGWQSADIEEAFNSVNAIGTNAQEFVQPKKRWWEKVVLIIGGIIVLAVVVVAFLPRFGLLNLVPDAGNIYKEDEKTETQEKVEETGLNLATTKLATIPNIYQKAPGTSGNQIDLPVFSSNGRQVAYAAEKNGKWLVVFGEKEGREYYNISYPVISPDGKQVAYGAQIKEGGGRFVVIGNYEGKVYNYIGNREIKFSPDGNKLVYVAEKEGRNCIVSVKLLLSPISEEEGRCYAGIIGIVFSPDSEHIAYIATIEGKNVVVLDGQEDASSLSYDSIIYTSLLFSPDSKRLAYSARKADKWYLIVDGEERSKGYEQILGTSIVFGPDSQQIAYWAKQAGNVVLVMDGEEKRNYYDYGGPIAFSRDGKLVAYIAETDGDRVMGIMDTETKLYSDNVIYNMRSGLTFTPDNEQVVYVAVTDTGESYIVVGDNRGKTYDYVSTPVFSTDSKYIAYGARMGNELWWIVENIKEFGQK